MKQPHKNDNQFLHKNDHAMIDGACGLIEIMTSWPKHTEPKGIGVVCHPHPLHEGTMHNKVVTTTAKAFDKCGLATVRFNFRGVGFSEGEHGYSAGEIEDAKAVIAWAQSVLPHLPISIAGFSFGAFIAANIASKMPVQRLITIAPAVTNQAYDRLGSIDAPWLVIQGTEDEVIASSEVYQWYDKAKALQPQMLPLVKVAGASHFFHGKLIELREIIETHFNE